MADGISFDFFTQPFTETMAAANRATDRSTLYALRATGRLLARAAKAKAPVYKGTDPRAVAESGNLKKSIGNARVVNHIGTGDYSMRVGPWGNKKKGTAVLRYGTAEGHLSAAEGVALARQGHSFHRATAATRKKAAVQGSSTDGQLRGVPLYRSAMEEQYGYMAAGLAVAEGDFHRTYEEALAKAYERFK